MQVSSINNPAERKKLIGAIVLGFVALILLWWTFIGFGGSNDTGARVTQRNAPAAAPSPTPRRVVTTNPEVPAVDVELRPVKYDYSLPAVPEARRNIFVYYEKPIPVPSPPPAPSPSPPPPVLLASISPATVYARTSEFTLEITGDKFAPQLRVLIDGITVPARYRGPQQIVATVPASSIANAGSRQVTLRSPDGVLFSNSASLSVADPPKPNFSYVGILGSTRYVDTAIMQDKSTREIVNIQRGDLLGGRFRVTSISEKEIVVIDTNLKIKHPIPFSSQGDRGSPTQRPTPRVESEDDEP